MAPARRPAPGGVRRRGGPGRRRTRAAAAGLGRPRRGPRRRGARSAAWSIAGGADVEPARYREEPHERTSSWRPDRDAWELALLAAAAEAGAAHPRRLPRHAADGRGRRRRPSTSTPPTWSVTSSTAREATSSAWSRCAREPDSLVARVLGAERPRALPPPPVGARAPGLRRDGLGRGRHGRGDGERPRLARPTVSTPATGSASRVQWHPEMSRDQRLFDALVAAAPATRSGSDTIGAVTLELETDVLGAPYTVETIVLTPDEEGAVECNLVRLGAGLADGPRGALRARVLLTTSSRRSSRSGGPTAATTSTPSTCASTAARSASTRPRPTSPRSRDVLRGPRRRRGSGSSRRDGHDEVLLAAHSTGGLLASLWADDRRPGLPELSGMVLNSPWLDMQGPFWIRNVGTVAIRGIGRSRPMREIPRVINDFYGRSIHRDARRRVGLRPGLEAAWSRSRSTSAGCAPSAAPTSGCTAGSTWACPVLVLSSGGTRFPKQMSEEVHGFDIVLDVEQIRRWAPKLGPARHRSPRSTAPCTT